MSALFRRIRDHRILYPGVRGRATGVVGRAPGPVILVAEDCTAWLWIGVRGVSVCVAWVIFLGEILRGSDFGGGNSMGRSFQAGGGVPGVGGDSGDLVLLGGGPERASPLGCSGGGRSRVCRPCVRLGLRGNTNGVAEYADSRSRREQSKKGYDNVLRGSRAEALQLTLLE